QFLTEALVTGDLDHPNIVPIYELGTNGDGLYFYAMKHVRGISWDECIKKKSQDDNLDILMKVCDAVAFAHSRKIIHRDLKPENIMIGQFGEVLLMDWGLASAAKPGEKSGLFGSGNTLGGTPAYMSPECARGDGSKIGTATDIYLIGALLFEIISGHPPHDKKKAEDSLESALKNEIPQLNIQSELLTIALKAMETEPEDRFASVLELQDSIRNYRQHEESLTLTSNADDNYTRARVNESYGEYSAGMHACYEALKLWEDNELARELRNNIRLDYARLSMKREDYDLCLTLLKEENPEDRGLIRKATRMRDERARRLQLQNRLKYTLVATVVVTLLLMAFAYTTVSNQRTQAVYDNFINQTRLAEQLLQEGNWVAVQNISASIPIELREWEWDWIDYESRIELEPHAKLEQGPERIITSTDGLYRALIFSDSRLRLETAGKSFSVSLSGAIKDFHWFQESAGGTKAYILHGNTIGLITFQPGSQPQYEVIQSDLPAETLIISPAGSYYLVRQSPTEFFVHDSVSGRQISQLELLPEHYLVHPAFSKNESQLAGIEDHQNRIKTFDTVSGKAVEQSAPHPEYTTSPYTRLEFFKQDSLLLVKGKGNVIFICNVRHMNPRVTIPLQSQPTSIAISPDGDEILASTDEGQILLFHIPTSNVIWQFQQQQYPISNVSATMSNDDWLLYDASGQVFPLSEAQRATGQVLLQNEVPVLEFIWSPSTSSMITRDQRNRYLQINHSTFETTAFRLQVRRHSPNHIITIHGQDHLAFLHRTDGMVLYNLHTHQHKAFPQFERYQSITAHENTLLLASGQEMICFNPETETVIKSWHWDLGPLRSISMVNSTHVWIAAGDNRMHSFDLNSAKLQLLEQAPADIVGWLPDRYGKYVIGHARSREAYIYNQQSGRIETTLSGSNHVITGLILTPDMRRIIGTSADGNIRIWDTARWEELVNFRAHVGTATCAGMSPDGVLLYSAGTDGTIRIWKGLPD
ncbi:MAG: WD40 repeat domain-containing serine/threonine-protein kinase, partial [Verrucomicrobiota bacterium]